MQNSRLFFGIEVVAPWPEEPWPPGRLLKEASRHTTLAFLGNVPYIPLQERLSQIPLPAIPLGPSGRFDSCLFLPPKRPRVVAWHITWDQAERWRLYREQLTEWLRSLGYQLDLREDLPHVTLARWPFDRSGWKALAPLHPVFGRALHLYESMGNLTYEARWTHAFIEPFVVLSHTADLAFLIRGETMPQLFLHAQLALAFTCPSLLRYTQPEEPKTLNTVIQALNRLIARADADIGVPLKAVSYHGEPFLDQQLIGWEMIVDV